MGATESREKLTERAKETKLTLDAQIQKQTERVTAMKSTNPEMLPLLIDNLRYSVESQSNFSDDTLFAAWIADQQQCEQILVNCFENVLKPPIDRHVYEWFKSTILTSPILLWKSLRGQYLYDVLVAIATKYAAQTECDMNKIYDSLKEDEQKWQELQSIGNESFIIRQDDEENVALLNNKKLYSHAHNDNDNDDDEKKEESAIAKQQQNMSDFIDIHLGVNELVAVANNLNHEFQAYIGAIMKDLGEFHQGPLKTYQRCQAKVENDYSDSKFPRCARLLDLVRCSITYDNLSKMLIGYHYLCGFCQNVAAKQNNGTPKLQIARIKNGFLDSTSEHGGYRDIKVNAIYFSETHQKRMICEIQFILRPFLTFKKKAHKLYFINRQKVYFQMASDAYYGLGGITQIETVYAATNFAKGRSNGGEMGCCISSKYNVVASYSALENAIIVTDFQQRNQCTNGHYIAVKKKTPLILYGGCFAFILQKSPHSICFAKCDEFGVDKKFVQTPALTSINVSEWVPTGDIINFGVNQARDTLFLLYKVSHGASNFLLYSINNSKTFTSCQELHGYHHTIMKGITESSHMSVSPTGDYIAISSKWGNKRFVQLKTVCAKRFSKLTLDQRDEFVREYEIEGFVGTMATCFHRNAANNELFLIAAACKKTVPFQSKICVWNVQQKEPVQEIELDESEGQIKCLINNGSVLVAACACGEVDNSNPKVKRVIKQYSKIKVWDISTWRVIYNQAIDMKIVNAMSVSEDGQFLAISGNADITNDPETTQKTLIVLKLIKQQ